MLKRFEFAARSNEKSNFYQFWTHENHAISCINADFKKQKLDYIHNNPVRAGTRLEKEDRLKLHFSRKQELASQKIDYILLSGDWDSRFQQAVDAIQKLL